ncbi:MAG: hypothetical protein JO297_06845 [Nitrososphaeraceae archaeon]|nr:hypothetical protein [Nitrososphaeraceae archaeon]
MLIGIRLGGSILMISLGIFVIYYQNITDYIALCQKTRELAFNHIKDQKEKDAFKAELTKFLKYRPSFEGHKGHDRKKNLVH